MEQEQVFKQMSRSGVLSLVLGVLSIVTGITFGVLAIVNGGLLLKDRHGITF